MKRKNKTKAELEAENQRLNQQAINDLAMINNLRRGHQWSDMTRYRYKIALERIAEINNGSVACEIAENVLEENE